MDSDKVPFDSFDKRRDDAVFLEFLLNHHTDIINDQDDIDKILYSMEISRLLARVAVHERVNAVREKRPRNDEIYEKYNGTALFIARRGIDFGIQLAFDKHEKGDDVPDIGYNQYMGWLYAQYSMILLESNRFFAAMKAIDDAEAYYTLDRYQLSTDAYTDKFVEQLKKMPYAKKFKLNVSHRQLREKVKECVEVLTRDLYLAVLEKKVRILMHVYTEVPPKYKDLYANSAILCIMQLRDLHADDCIQCLKEAIWMFQKQYPNPVDFRDLAPGLSIAGEEAAPNLETQNYIMWANIHHLVLSFLDFMPDCASRCAYSRDDLELSTEDTDMNAMFEDIMETFARCRFQLYIAQTYEDPNTAIAYCLSPKAKRIQNQEVLLDMYPRLYSVLDKTSHLVIKHFGITLAPKKNSPYPPTPSYNAVVNELKKHESDNPYLMTLCEIYKEINPRHAYREMEDIPFYAMLPKAEHMDNIRHHIVHSGVCLTVEDTGNKSNQDVAYIRERELAQQCMNLIALVKEAVMNTFLAIEYKNRQIDSSI